LTQVRERGVAFLEQGLEIDVTLTQERRIDGVQVSFCLRRFALAVLKRAKRSTFGECLTGRAVCTNRMRWTNMPSLPESRHDQLLRGTEELVNKLTDDLERSGHGVVQVVRTMCISVSNRR
jgi:hypothetical protein